MTRTITDPSELDALPPWAAVEDVLGIAWVRHPGTPDRADHWVSYYGDRLSAQYVAAESPLTVLHDPSAPVVPVVSDAAVEAAVRVLAPFVFDDRRLPFRTHGESRSTEELREAERAREFAKARAALSAALPFLGAAPSATREEVRDEIAGHPIGSGYYANSVSVDEAFEIADALLARFTITPRTDR